MRKDLLRTLLGRGTHAGQSGDAPADGWQGVALPLMEPLPERRLLSASITFSAGTLTLTDDGTDGEAFVYASGSGGQMTAEIRHSVNGQPVDKVTPWTGTGVTAIVMYGDNGDDYLHVDGATCNVPVTIWAGAGRDTLEGGLVADVLDGQDGFDTIYGNAGNDSLIGDDGDYGGDDWIDGGAGDDYIDARDDSDEVYGGDGNDWINGGGGEDLISGNDGDDTLVGGPGSDQIWAGSGDDVVNGGIDDDTIYAGLGADNIDGGDGNDYMQEIFDGNVDTVIGGNGFDVLTGGRDDADLFYDMEQL